MMDQHNFSTTFVVEPIAPSKSSLPSTTCAPGGPEKIHGQTTGLGAEFTYGYKTSDQDDAEDHGVHPSTRVRVAVSRKPPRGFVAHANEVDRQPTIVFEIAGTARRRRFASPT